jgi:hypothetical protein
MPSLKELRNSYNESAVLLGRTEVNRFRDKKTAERRCDAIQAEVRKFRSKHLDDLLSLDQEAGLFEESTAEQQPMPEQTNGEFKLRGGTIRADVYNTLSQNLGRPIPAVNLTPNGKGTDYAVKKLNEKLTAAGSPFEITRSKVEKVVYFALTERSDG